MNRTLLVVVGVLLCVVLGGVVYLSFSEKPAQPTVNSAPTPPKPDPGEEAFKIVMDSNATYEARVLAIKRLPKVLSASQASALRGLMKTKGVHPTIRNDVLAYLDEQPVKPVGMDKDLIGMFQDQAEDATWRDYCLQHFEPVYEFSPEKEQVEIEKTLIDAASAKTMGKTNFPGTAMLSLERLSKKHPRVAAALKTLAEKGVAAAAEDPERAVTALQIARENKDKSVLPVARKLASDDAVLIRLRMSAIGTLGEIGEQADVALLAKLAESKDGRIKTAAQNGLTTLQKAQTKGEVVK